MKILKEFFGVIACCALIYGASWIMANAASQMIWGH